MNGGGDPPGAQGTGLQATATIAAAGALVTGIGALSLTGTLGRVQRNHEVAFVTAITLLIVGAGLIAGSSVVGGWPRRLIQGIGMIAAIVGAAIGFGAAIDTASETERPTLDVRLDPRTLTVTGTVSAANLSSGDGLEVRVDGLVDFDHNLDTVDHLQPVNLSRTVVGPDSDGNATQDIDVQLPHGGYDAVGVTASVGEQEQSCGLARQVHVDGGTACINLPLPRRLSRPALTAAWGRRSGGERIVVLHVDGRDLNAGSWPPRPLIVRVVGLRRDRGVRLYRAVIDPTARGVTQEAARVGVPLDMRVVCAGVTRAQHAPLACPIHGNDPGTVELHVVTAGASS